MRAVKKTAPASAGSRKPIRVLMVMESWGKGGTETYVSGLAQTLAERRFDLGLALLRGPSPGKLPGFAPRKVSTGGYTGLIRRIRKEHPDYLSLHLYTSLLPAVLLGRLSSVPVVATLHIPLSAWGFRHRLYWRTAMVFSNLVAGVSKEILDELKGKNILGKALPGGVDPLFFKIRRKKHRKSPYFRIAAVGRLEPQKDWPTLIQAVSLLPARERKKTRLHFYGTGSQLGLLKSLAVQGGMDAVFHGHVGQSALAAALSDADLSILPSRFEGLGLSALEGMAVGVPTLTADFSASRSFIDPGVTGHSFPIGDPGALAKLMLWHLRNPGGSFRMGQAGRKFAEGHFSRAAVFAPYWSIFSRPAPLA